MGSVRTPDVFAFQVVDVTAHVPSWNLQRAAQRQHEVAEILAHQTSLAFLPSILVEHQLLQSELRDLQLTKLTAS
jgi:hypothetical protein